MAAQEQRKSTADEPLAPPIAGFDTDLLPRDLLAKHRKDLPRARMVAALNDGRVAVVVNALEALSVQGPPTAAELPMLTICLKAASPSVRAAAARALAEAQDVAEVVTALAPATADRDPAVRADATAVLRGFGVAALPTLIGLLRLPGPQADATLLPHIAALGHAALEPLQVALAHPFEPVRANALAGLLLLGHEALTASERRLRAMASGDPATEVRRLARQAVSLLAQYGRATTLPARALPLAGFGDGMLDDAALQKAGRAMELEALQALTRDGRASVRANAWKAIAALGPLDEVWALQAAVACKDAESDVRREAALALRKCPASVLPQVLPPLVVASRDADRSVAQAARTAVFSQGKLAAPQLVVLFGERDARVHAPAVALAAALEADAVTAVTEALDAPLPLVRLHALQALAAIGGKPLDAAAGKITACLRDSHDPVRGQALLTLAQLSASACKSLKGLSEHVSTLRREDPSLTVRQAAERAALHLAALGL